MIVSVARSREPMADAAPTVARILLACLRLSNDELFELCAHPGIDWLRVAAEARLHRVVPLVLAALQRSGVVAARYVPAAVVADLKTQRRTLTALNVRLDAALAVVLDALAAASVPVVVLKGLALARLYPSTALRPHTDIDLLVDPEHWPAAERVVAGLSYRLLDAEHVRRPLLSRVQAPEDQQYQHPTGTTIELHADFLSTGLLRAEDRTVWQRVQTVKVGALRIPTLSPGDEFLQVTTHMQRHAFTRLLWFHDLALLLQAEGEWIDWPAVARRAERAGVGTSAYFGLNYTEALLGPLVTPDVRRLLRPNAVRRRLHEGMWPRQRILALDSTLIPLLDAQQGAGLSKSVPLPPTVFDVYDPPDKMLAHLLTSGNIRPKLCVLGRRLVPTEEWLRYYGPLRVKQHRTRLWLSRLTDRWG